MNMKLILPALASVLAIAMAQAAPIDSAAGRPHGMAVDFSAVLQVEEADKVSSQVIARAESLGGWFSQRGKTTVRLRIPAESADGFIRSLGEYGVLLDRNLSTQSLEGERDELLSRLKARKATLADYYAMLKESSDSTVFTIQSEIVNLQTEIENTQGRILKLEDRMAYAHLTLDFRFRERDAPLVTGVSRFRWLNRLGLPSLMERFRHGSH
jgi:hypothetical protein